MVEKKDIFQKCKTRKKEGRQEKRKEGREGGRKERVGKREGN